VLSCAVLNADGDIYNICMKNMSYVICKSCNRRFFWKYPCMKVPASSVIFKFLRKVHSSRPLLERKYSGETIVPISAELEIGDSLNFSPCKSLI
jgi:hypothetical protein